MNYIIRKSTSNSIQPFVESLQNGYIFRFNSIEQQIINSMDNSIHIDYICDEIWIDTISSNQEINIILPKDCIMNQDQLNYISTH